MRGAADVVIRSLHTIPIRVTANSLNSALLKLTMGGSLGMLMALAAIIDPLFSGETQVAPAPIERAIQRNLERV